MYATKLVYDFALLDKITLGEDPDTAYDRCWDLATAFAWFCIGRGVDAWVMRVAMALDPCTSPRAPADDVVLSHYIVWLPVEGVAVDWTARQFWEAAPHPWIMSREEVYATWMTIEWPEI